jgi:DNA-binding transcriptional LysR family regulator
VAVTEKAARGVRLTTAGEVLVWRAGQVLDGVAAASQEMAGLRDRLAGRLVVGGFPTATAALLPGAVARLLADHPGLQVQLREASMSAQLKALWPGRLEVAILARGEGLPRYDLDGLHVCKFPTGRGAGVAVPESHPFAVRDWVEPQEPDGQAWVVWTSHGEPPEFGPWPGMAEPEVSFVVRDWPTRLRLVRAGIGIALVPGIAAPAVPHGVRWIPVRDQGGGLRRQVCAVLTYDAG